MDWLKTKLFHRQILSSSSLAFTQRMFAYMFKHKYVVGEHHIKICEALDEVVRGKTQKLIINIAPRYGKTLLVSQMFIAYGLAINPSSKFLHLSYSGTLTQDNSMAVKDIIICEYYQNVFDTRIKFGSDTKAKWETEQGGGVYATSTLGQITGFGAGRVELETSEEEEETLIDEFTARYNPNLFAGAIVIDDPIKPDDALSDVVREKVNLRFETTIRNRVNSRNTPIIVVMQRLHEHDLCGYLQDIEKDDWKVLSIPCIETDENGNEKPLWEFKHSLEELHKISIANSFVFQTQYMQNPTPLEGFMYPNLKTYDELPIMNSKAVIKNYTDTADTGSDWLCSVCYVEYEFGMYIIDVLYTKKPMEYTEVETAKMLTRNKVQLANIESNNGGRGFARNVEKNLRLLENKKTEIRTFTMSGNKDVRIFSHSAEVQNMIFFPSDWDRRWREFYNDVKSFRKEGRNAHDDAPDVLTGMIEKMTRRPQTSDEDLLYDFY